MDPIANLLCCIRNGQHANKTYVSVPYSRVVWSIVHVLYAHGYIDGMGIREPHSRKKKYAARICIVLKSPRMIQSIVRVSCSNKRVYLPVHHLRNTMDGFGIRILSTTKGIMADIDAIPANVGGEILCAVV